MKDQYFGDINDYRKYGLLRTLTGEDAISLGVCWMLTAPDSSTEGNDTGYLTLADKQTKAFKYKAFDNELFNQLRKCAITFERVIVRQDLLVQAARKDAEFPRDVRSVKLMGILPERTRFFTDLLVDNAAQQDRYFGEMLQYFDGVDLIFFDPDTGFEVASKKRGSQDSSKYLHWEDLAKTYRTGVSVLSYQHFGDRSQSREQKVKGGMTKTM